METKRLFDFLTEQIEKRGDSPFIASKAATGTGKEWKHYTFRQTQETADRVSQLLLNLGLKKDDKIALISANRVEWNFVDLGSQQVGVINVPMYPTIAEKDYEFIFNDAGIQYAFVGDESVLAKVRPLMGRVSSLKGIYSFDKITGTQNFWDSLPSSSAVNKEEINKRKNAVTEDDLATIIYTSGTTGNPKGVMLMHRNMVSNIRSVKQVTPFGEGEKALSFLPLNHSFERIVFFSYMAFGVHIHYAESLETIGENLKEVQPYCFTTVPRLLEKVYEKIMAKGNELTGFKRKLFFWSINLGAQYELGGNGLWYKIKLAIARKLVFSKWLEALGGRVQFIVTGASAMQARLIKLFTAAGINVLEGYGLTETSPVLCANRIDENERCIGAVGMPIPGVEIKLAEDGEIIAKGPNIMKGYYNRPDLTAEVIDKDGWFHTGDIGTWVERKGHKFLKITDRKKELFKTAGGKYVAPQPIEEKMKESRFIEQIMIVGGDDKKFVSALIVPSFLNLRDWCKEQGIAVETNEQIVDNSKIKDLINQEVEKYNSNFGKWEQVKKFALLSSEWTVDAGELTPTMKVKRKVILERYNNHVQEIYKSETEFVA